LVVNITRHGINVVVVYLDIPARVGLVKGGEHLLDLIPIGTASDDEARIAYINVTVSDGSGTCDGV
jgi:hypothetical protein